MSNNTLIFSKNTSEISMNEYVGNTPNRGDCVMALIKNIYRFYGIKAKISGIKQLELGYTPNVGTKVCKAVFSRTGIEAKKLKIHNMSSVISSIRESIDENKPVVICVHWSSGGCHVYLITNFVRDEQGNYMYLTVNRGYDDIEGGSVSDDGLLCNGTRTAMNVWVSEETLQRDISSKGMVISIEGLDARSLQDLKDLTEIKYEDVTRLSELRRIVESHKI